MEDTSPSLQPIFTLYDAITDSPVFRTNTCYYEQQLDHLEHWLDSFSRHLKQYAEKLKKLNSETIILCQKMIPKGDEISLIGTLFSTAVIQGFSDALQSSLTFKTNFISNLEESLVTPLQQFVKTHLKDFRSFHKQYQKSLERYESQLAKYSSINKSRDPSSIREEAFRLHEVRKEYTHLSSQYVIRVIEFRSLLEHCLVERFSTATVTKQEFYKDIEVWAHLNTAISYWKQWLLDDKMTCAYQLYYQRKASKQLEEEYIRLMAPDRDIGKYITTPDSQDMLSNLTHSQWGYLFLKTSKHSWSRRWVYVHAGQFGITQLDSSKVISKIRVPISECKVEQRGDMDRRFCFDVRARTTVYTLQAETEESLRIWLRAFEAPPQTDLDLVKSPTLIIQQHGNLETSIDSSSVNNSKSYPEEGTSIVMVSTTPDTEATLSNSSSLTPLLVWKAAGQIPVSLGTWGIPRSLIPAVPMDAVPVNTTLADQVIWPPETKQMSEEEIKGFDEEMKLHNRELRNLFEGVKPNEMVLDVFIGCLKKRPQSVDDNTDIESPSKYGYAYVGYGFITEDAFWFYSCILTTCINSVVVRLKDILSINIVDDKHERILLLKTENNNESLAFSTFVEDIEMIAKKLKLAIQYAKSTGIHTQTLYEEMKAINTASHQSVMINLPKSFKSAITSLSKKRRAATISAPEKTEQTSLVSRHRGGSEPIKPIATVKALLPDPNLPPEHIQCPNEPVSCNCDDHLDRLECQITLPISAKRLYELMFSEEQSNGGVWAKKTEAIEGHDLTVSKWYTENGKMQRLLKYWMPVSNPIVRMKEAEVVETQILIQKNDYICYTVQISTKTAALPYADAFIPSVRYCITWVSQSECQLSCYLGVRWTQRVLVRGIVTKAALKGMADSIQVFIPILKNAAEEIKNKVNEMQYQVEQHNKKLLNQQDYNNSKDQEYKLEEPIVSDQSKKLDEDRNVKPQKEMAATILTPKKQLQIPELPPITTITKTEQKAEESVAKATIMQPATNKDTAIEHRHAETTYCQKTDSNNSKQWLEKFFGQYTIEILVAIISVLLVYIIATRFWWQQNNNKPVLLATQEVSRSVYLRDLNEGFLNSAPLPPYAESESYKAFLEATKHRDTAWYSIEHYQLATDLEFSRKQLAMLRCNLLTSFQILNKLDTQLVEQAYVNWMLDTRLKCKLESLLENDRGEQAKMICQHVQEQLDVLYFKKNKINFIEDES
ncbi:uncharacterized protein BX663DRAFT_481716 [Cokeromyces recurvatus]|uniref:uncharacterized protein n=1 Tax=Cokeromyces recurvatus TaxID=90255 RepID=UPI0022203ACC|nr:uncharacterized protein BX663DRAFT_481716 [Cokeromyces recurvatus]KAI7897495.1 hypothetical protein BX663DRAFT_481716 [Cokeromyces recurvatus]